MMRAGQTTALVCPKCKHPTGVLTDPAHPHKPVLIFACEVCGHLWTRPYHEIDRAADCD
jgi:hypothetical protein